MIFNAFPLTHMLQRTFLSMIPHELGHAITGWWCGFTAIPGLWKTLIPEERSMFAIVIALAIAVGFAYIGRRFERRWAYAVAVVMGLAQLRGVTLPLDAAQNAITFGGDAGAMVIGALLMLAFFAPEGSKLRLGAVRWGLLVIGAAALVDAGMTWYRARKNYELIPYGEIEGVGLSDPSKLLEAGWREAQIVGRFTTVAALCTLVVLGVWIWQTYTMRQRALTA